MNSPIPELNILVVEDEDSKIVEWEDAIDFHNVDAEGKGFRVNMVTAKSVVDAKKKLDLYRFDAAVVDLRLQVDPRLTENNTQGNDLVRHILGVQPLGVVVYTGQRADADHRGYNCPQVKVMDKAEGMDQIFEWLGGNKDIFLNLRDTKNAFNCETAKIFYGSIWPRWSQWTSPTEPRENLTAAVARHVVAHVHDSMLRASGDKIHPEEAYFVPPLKDRIDTGDLVRCEDGIWVVVTPRCDLARINIKVKSVLLAFCEDKSLRWNDLNSSGSGKSREEQNKMTQHNKEQKQHFLHQMSDETGSSRGPWMVQFDHLKVVDQHGIDALASSRFASLSPLFIPSLVERFGAYFSRIGTPDYSRD